MAERKDETLNIYRSNIASRKNSISSLFFPPSIQDSGSLQYEAENNAKKNKHIHSTLMALESPPVHFPNEKRFPPIFLAKTQLLNINIMKSVHELKLL